MIDNRYIYRQHKIIYNEKLYGICPIGDSDPMEMLCIGSCQLEFDPYIPNFTGRITMPKPITFFTTYKIIESKLYIGSFEVIQYCEENEDGIIYVESLDKIFIDITENGVFAEFFTGVINFDEAEEDTIDDGNYNKYYCLVKKGIIIRIVQSDTNPFKSTSNKFENLLEDLYNLNHFSKSKINFLDPQHKNYFPIKALEENNVLTKWGYDINYGLGSSNYKLNSYEKDTYDELTDGNNGD